MGMQSMAVRVGSCLIAVVGMLTRADAAVLPESEVAKGTFARFFRNMVCGTSTRATVACLKHLQDQSGMILTPPSVTKQFCSRFMQTHTFLHLPADSPSAT